MNNTPKISVVIPCFNNETTVLETIESVVQQDYISIEIIVINDGSTDLSRQVIDDYAKSNKITNIILFDQENLGLPRARNCGADKATGEYLLFLDADDIIAPTYISKCIASLSQDKTLNIVYAEAEYFGARSGSWILPDFNLPNFIESNCIPASAVIRNEVFQKVGKFDENLKCYEDWELWIRIVKEFGGVHKIKEPLFFYRKRFDQSSILDNEKDNNIGSKSTLYIYNKHYAFFSENNYGIQALLQSKKSNEKEKYKEKYYNVWYRKLFYKLSRKR